MKPLVSIIVPVYESMRDLKDSVDSILAQTYENIEILLVDSDSKDGSAALCRDYEIQNQRVRFFSKEDEGVSASRNLGIRMAQGDYLQFADSDDVLLPKASEILVKHMEQSSADIVIGGYRMRKEGAEKSPKPAFYKDIFELMPHFSEYYNHYHNTINAPWNKMYRKSAIKHAFPEDMSKGEDLFFNLKALEHAKGILFAEDVVYEYNNINQNSLGYRFREDGFSIDERLFYEVREYYCRNRKEESKPEDLQFIYDVFLDGLKGKCISLILRSGKPGKECLRFIHEWLGRASVKKDLMAYKKGFSQKDQVLLTLIRFRLKRVIYCYYRYIYQTGK